MLSIISAKYQKDYKINLEFNNNQKGVVDLYDLVHEDENNVFAKIKNKNLFKNFKVDYTLIWSDELDIAPEYLYFKSFANDKNKQKLFKEWGYV
jgi:hypothetical protein